MAGLIGKKVGMTQIFSADGVVVPVTVILAGPCSVLEVWPEKGRVKLGFGEIKMEKLKKPRQGYFKKIKLSPQRHVRDFQLLDGEQFQAGQQLGPDLFQPGDKVDVTGLSKGRGFTGVIKRWGFRRQQMSHGHTEHRRTGSIGSTSTPGRVVKGKRMAGRHGGDKVTVRNLEVVSVRPEGNLLLVRGAVPGPANSLLLVKRSRKQSQRSPGPEN